MIALCAVVLLLLICSAVLIAGWLQHRKACEVARYCHGIRCGIEHNWIKEGEYRLDRPMLMYDGREWHTAKNPYGGHVIYPVELNEDTGLGRIYFQTVYDGTHYILVMFAEAPRWPEVAWGFASRWLISDKEMRYRGLPVVSHYGEPVLVWIGGDCGTNEEWLARGITPQELPEYLERCSGLVREDQSPAPGIHYIPDIPE